MAAGYSAGMRFAPLGSPTELQSSWQWRPTAVAGGHPVLHGRHPCIAENAMPKNAKGQQIQLDTLELQVGCLPDLLDLKPLRSVQSMIYDLSRSQ